MTISEKSSIAPRHQLTPGTRSLHSQFALIMSHYGKSDGSGVKRLMEYSKQGSLRQHGWPEAPDYTVHPPPHYQLWPAKEHNEARGGFGSHLPKEDTKCWEACTVRGGGGGGGGSTRSS